MVGNTITLTNNTQWVNEDRFKVEYRSNSGVGIIKWYLPTTRELNKVTAEKISKKELDKLYHLLSKSFLARTFIDLDIFLLPDAAMWMHDAGYKDDPYGLPKGRSKVRIDETDEGSILVCQWHLPSHLLEYFNSHSADGKSFGKHWDRNQLADTVVEYLKLIH